MHGPLLLDRRRLALIRMTGTTPVIAAKVGATLGEGPVWDTSRDCLWFVDIKQHRLFRLDPASDALQSWPAPGQIGWVLPAADGQLIAGLQDGLYRFDPRDGSFRYWMGIPGEPAGNRLNDAATAPDGAIWFGSMDDAEQADSGRIYRMSSGQITCTALPAVCITNGPALSPDGRVLYHTDTLGRCIRASDLDEQQHPCNTRILARIEDGAGYPDGPVVDAAGCLWTGLFGGWSARRYSPDGILLQEVRFPVANITKLAFGGADLQTVYATTACKGLSAAELAAQPQAGDLFSFRVAVPGLPVTQARP